MDENPFYWDAWPCAVPWDGDHDTMMMERNYLWTRRRRRRHPLRFPVRKRIFAFVF